MDPNRSCSSNGNLPLQEQPRNARWAVGLWRPWQITAKDIERHQQRVQSLPYHLGKNTCFGTSVVEQEKLKPYRHPVKLLWPKSKRYDYLYQKAEVLLRDFPVQATISFYDDPDTEDESDSDREAENGTD
nr:PREDICTED: protein ripply2 [Latimeria chalumnae]|eukprot:XP_005995116.1 PREDICTED: protein ripply2 [Latimeria chalumnae]